MRLTSCKNSIGAVDGASSQGSHIPRKNACASALHIAGGYSLSGAVRKPPSAPRPTDWPCGRSGVRRWPRRSSSSPNSPTTSKEVGFGLGAPSSPWAMVIIRVLGSNKINCTIGSRQIETMKSISGSFGCSRTPMPAYMARRVIHSNAKPSKRLPMMIYIYIYRNSELWWILHCRCVRDIRCIAAKHCKAHMSSELTDAHSDQGIQPPAKRFKVWDKEKTGPFFSTFWPFSTTFGSYLQLLGTQKLRGDFDEVYNLLPFFSRVLDAMRACREV